MSGPRESEKVALARRRPFHDLDPVRRERLARPRDSSGPGCPSGLIVGKHSEPGPPSPVKRGPAVDNVGAVHEQRPGRAGNQHLDIAQGGVIVQRESETGIAFLRNERDVARVLEGDHGGGAVVNSHIGQQDERGQLTVQTIDFRHHERVVAEITMVLLVVIDRPEYFAHTLTL